MDQVSGAAVLDNEEDDEEENASCGFDPWKKNPGPLPLSGGELSGLFPKRNRSLGRIWPCQDLIVLIL